MNRFKEQWNFRKRSRGVIWWDLAQWHFCRRGEGLRCLARAEITLWNLEEGNCRFFNPFSHFCFQSQNDFSPGLGWIAESWVLVRLSDFGSRCSSHFNSSNILLPLLRPYRWKVPFYGVTCVIPCNGRHSHHNDDQILTITRGSVWYQRGSFWRGEMEGWRLGSEASWWFGWGWWWG